jgi:hypothetical protein
MGTCVWKQSVAREVWLQDQLRCTFYGEIGFVRNLVGREGVILVQAIGSMTSIAAESVE